MFIFNLKFNFKIYLTLCLFFILFLYNLIFPDLIFADEGLSVMELDGWSNDPGSNPNLSRDFPWDIMFLYGFINLYTYFSIIPLEFPSYAEVGVQTEPLVEIYRHLTSLSSAISDFTGSESPANSLSVLLSETPSVAATESYYPELVRSSELTNALKAQDLYNDLLQNVNPESPHYKVYKVFVGHSKRIFFNALCSGLVEGTPEFTQFMDNSLTNNTQLVSYLAHNGVNIQDLLT